MSRSIPDIEGRIANASGVGSGLRTSRPAVSRRQNIILRQAEKKKTSWPVFLFLTALVVPWVIPVGTLRMSLYRIVLVVMVLPCLGMWMAGKAGRIRIADIALLLFWFWCTLSFIVVNGAALTTQSSGILFVETAGAYLLARCYVRDADDFYKMVQLLFRIVVILLPFAIVECVTGQNILRDLFAAILPTQQDPVEAGRLGLSRAYSVFDHPILFGVCISSIFALIHLVLGYQQSFFRRTLRTGIVGVTTFCSLSSGPLIALTVQGLLLLWNWLLRGTKIRWKILIGLLVFIDILIELFAKRSALEIVTGFFLLDQGSYWFRKLLFQAAWASAANHPLFGVGMNEWERPGTMPLSIDNFWLSIAVEHGLPAVFLILLSVFSIFLSVSFTKGLDDRLMAYRTGFLISITAFVIVGCTVAFWDATYVLFVFLLGSGVWMLDVKAGTPYR